MDNITNGFFNFPDEDSESISNILTNLPLTKNGLINYHLLVHVIESAKINTVVRLVKSCLDSDSTAKVIVCVKFIESQEKLRFLLSEYQPFVTKLKFPTRQHRLIIATRKYLNLDTKNYHVFLTFDTNITGLHKSTKVQLVYDKRNEKEMNIIGRRSKHYVRFIEE